MIENHHQIQSNELYGQNQSAYSDDRDRRFRQRDRFSVMVTAFFGDHDR
jgi:hypothetical protein